MKFLSIALLAASLATSAFGSIVYVSGSVPGGGGSTAASFTGSFDYTAAVGGASATLTVKLTNTSPLANGGYITAFVFNNPNDAITGATFGAGSEAGWNILGGTTYDNTATAPPLGLFDIGSVLAGGSSDWAGGGGNPSAGIAVNDEGTWVFNLTGTGLDAIDAPDFFTTYSQDEVNVKGKKTYVDTTYTMAVRFRGFVDGGSAKVPGECCDNPPRVVPEPSHYALMVGGASALLAIVRRRRNAAKS